jgi:predicted PurR-regulated permease PerM
MGGANSTRNTPAPLDGKSSANPPSDARAIVREFRPYLVGAGILPVVAALYWGRGVLIPIALACLFTFLLSPIVGALERAGLGRIRAGRIISATLVVGLVFSALGGAVWVIAPQVTALASELPQYRGNLMRKIAQVRGSARGGALAEVQTTAKEVMGELQKEPVPKGESKPLPVVVKPETGIWNLPRILEGLSAAGFVIVLVIFMLIERHEVRNRFIRLTGQGSLANVTRALSEASARISRYLIVQSMINATYGAALGTGLFFIGVPYAVMWGFLACLLRFLPYVGPPLAAVGPVVLSLAVFDGWQRPLATVALFVVVELVTYMIMEPLLYGQTIGVSPVALLVAVAFWTWLWGPIGLVLGTPLTVCLVVLGKHIPALSFLTVFMTDEPALPRDVGYYQRLLAKDPAEAAGILEAHLGEHGLVGVYDDIVVPALSHAKGDCEAQRVSREEAQAIYKAARGTVEDVTARHLLSRAAGSPDGAAGSPAGAARSKNGLDAGAPWVLGCAAGDEADEIALAMLRQLLTPTECAFEPISAHALSGEIVTRAADKKPGLFVIAALSPGALDQTRHLCKRLRARFPDIKIVVGRWGSNGQGECDRAPLLAAGADAVGANLRESRDQMLERLRCL